LWFRNRFRHRGSCLIDRSLRDGLRCGACRFRSGLRRGRDGYGGCGLGNRFRNRGRSLRDRICYGGRLEASAVLSQFQDNRGGKGIIYSQIFGGSL
jgi:hypothetical protein